MKVADGNPSSASRAANFDNCVKGIECNAHVRWMRGKTSLTRTEDSVHAMKSRCRRASHPGRPLVAGFFGVAEVGASRSLHQIPADGRYVTQLRRRAGQQRLRQKWILFEHNWMTRNRAVSGHRPDVERPSRGLVDIGQWEPINVDDLFRDLDFQLHQIDRKSVV